MASPTQSTSDHRVLLVTRRFWPHCDDAIGRLCSFAEGLRDEGFAPSIVAARYAASWPQEMTYRELPIFRPASAPRGDWSNGLYLRALAKWLREHGPRFALFYADNMRDEGASVVDAAAKQETPSVVRLGSSGAFSDAHWASMSRGNRRSFQEAIQATSIVAPDAAAARHALASGADREAVHRIDDGFPHILRRSDEAKQAALRALKSMNHDLTALAGERVVIVDGRMDEHSGMHEVAEWFASVASVQSNVRLWFFGDGPARESLHRLLCDLGIRHLTAMPGTMGPVAELFQVADAWIACTDTDGLEHQVPMAISAGVPCAVLDTAVTRARLAAAQKSIHWYRSGSPNTLPSVMNALLHDHAQALQDASVLQHDVIQRESRTMSIKKVATLFRALIEKHSVSHSQPTQGAAS